MYEDGNPKKKCSFFIEYFTINQEFKTKIPIIGPKLPCYALIKIGYWKSNYRSIQCNKFYSILDCYISTEYFYVKIGKNIDGDWINKANDHYICGHINTLDSKNNRSTLFSNQAEIYWDLLVKKRK